MPALLFGSIGAIADTSELQREAFNRAFSEHGLSWNWDQQTYRDLLTGSGGAARIAAEAERLGEDVDADAVHETKSQIFRKLLADQPVALRDGVAEAVEDARSGGFKVGLVTTTDPENVSALLGAIDGLEPRDFDLILDTSQVTERKPAPAAYTLALEKLEVEPGAAVAVEDNVGGVEAANAASVAVVAFPGENNTGHDFAGADHVVTRVSFADLAPLATAA